MRALVAEDSGVIRSVIKRVFADLGFEEIHESIDGQDAIEMVNTIRFDMIVTDWNMPLANGLDVVKASRKAGQTCPIVMQTTIAEKANVMAALAAGVNDYVLKPFNQEQMLNKLVKHMPIANG